MPYPYECFYLRIAGEQHGAPDLGIIIIRTARVDIAQEVGSIATCASFDNKSPLFATCHTTPANRTSHTTTPNRA